MSYIGCLAVTAVISLLIFSWVTFVGLICYPLFSTYPITWPIIYLVIFHIILFLDLWSYFRAIFTKSSIPKDFSHQGKQSENKTGPNKQFTETDPLDNSTKKRYCDKCKHDKPDRAHHCRRCEKCILKMDHHCIVSCFQVLKKM